MYVRKYSIPPARSHKPLASTVKSTFYAPESTAALPDGEKVKLHYGKETYKWSNGTSYEGEWEDDKAHGLSKESDLAPESTATLPEISNHRAVNFVIPHTFTDYK